MDQELKAALDVIKGAFEEFKKTNDERLARVEKGMATADLDAKLAKINETINANEEKYQAKLTAMEAAFNRPGSGGHGESPEKAKRREAMNRYIRRGDASGLLDARAEMTTGSAPDGGFLVSEETAAGIATLAYPLVSMRQLATVQTLGASLLEMNVDMDNAEAGFVGAADSRAETDTPTLKQVTVRLEEMYANPKVEQRLLDDSTFNVEAFINEKIARAFGKTEANAFITGNGVKAPRGVTNYTTVADATFSADVSGNWGKIGHIVSGAAGAFSANPGDRIYNLVYSLEDEYAANASFLMKRSTLNTVRQFKDGNGLYLWQPSMQAGQPSLLCGYPVAVDAYMPAVAANSLSIAFGDFKRAYLIVERPQVSILRDPYTTKGKVSFYTTKRVGGGVVNFEAIKLMKFSA